MAYDLTRAGTDARRLAYFLAVVDSGTMTAAAKQLRIAQPSLSAAISDLERDLGTSLFDRVGRRVVLNETGRALAVVARQMVSGLASAWATVDAREQLTTGEVTITAPASLTIYPLGPAIASFNGRHPGIAIRVLNLSPNNAGEVVAAAKADVAFAVADSEEEHQPGTRVRAMGVHEVVAVLPPGSRSSSSIQCLTREALASWPLIAAEPGTRQRQLIDEMVSQGFPVRVVAEIAHRESFIPLVLAGVGATLLPWSLARIARQLGATVVGLDPPILSHMVLIHRAEPSSAAAAFVDVVLRTSGDVLAQDDMSIGTPHGGGPL